MKAIIAPSLLSADFANLGFECQQLEKAGIKWLHLDIIDGMFAPNITFGFPVLKALRPLSSMIFDAHLMIEEPDRYFETFALAGADIIVPHIECMKHPCRSLMKIRELNLKAGIALNPGTDFSCLRWLLPYLDLVMIMGVNPGFSGQHYIEETEIKVKECRSFLVKHGYGALPIEVDGGISPENAASLASAGASILVSGSSFFKFGNSATALKKYSSALENAFLANASEKALECADSWRHKH